MSLQPARVQERVFERLYRHVGDVYRYALVVLCDPDSAETVTQATFVNALRAHQQDQLECSVACHQAERAVSRKLDGRLSRADRKLLRAHLRSCPDCLRLQRLQLESRAALRSLRATPVPDSLRISGRGLCASLLVRATASAE